MFYQLTFPLPVPFPVPQHRHMTTGAVLMFVGLKMFAESAGFSIPNSVRTALGPKIPAWVSGPYHGCLSPAISLPPSLPRPPLSLSPFIIGSHRDTGLYCGASPLQASMIMVFSLLGAGALVSLRANSREGSLPGKLRWSDGKAMQL